jgi:hypothetical protein
MAVVAGVVFFAVRALLAPFPALTTGLPIKKWSAAAALVAAAFYLLLSRAEVATQRSFFMTAVVLIAVMVDRRAITFRTLAVAAMIVLAMAPEALVQPNDQDAWQWLCGFYPGSNPGEQEGAHLRASPHRIRCGVAEVLSQTHTCRLSGLAGSARLDGAEIFDMGARRASAIPASRRRPRLMASNPTVSIRR